MQNLSPRVLDEFGADPVFSYYEFKHPMSDRLTDEKWKKLLRGRAKKPALPKWSKTFGVGVEQR